MIGLKDLPNDTYISFGKLIYNKNGDLIDIKEDYEFLKDLIGFFQNEAKDVKYVSNEIGIPRSLIYKILKWKRKIRLGYLIKICKYLEEKDIKKYSISSLENRIYSISSSRGGTIVPYLKENGILERKFPFNFKTIEGIKCLTFPFGDGYISKDYSGHIRVGYVNSNLSLHNEVVRCMKKTFGNIDYSQRKITAAYDTYFTGIIGKIYVNCLNFEFGKKAKIGNSLPKEILELRDPILIGACISQFLDDEGNMSDRELSICQSAGENFLSDNKDEITDIKKYIPNILVQLSKLLKIINVESYFRKPCFYYDTTRKKWKLTYYLMIRGYDNILFIFPFLSIKKGSLKNKIHERIKKFIYIANRMESIQKMKGYFNIKDIVESLDMPTHSVNNHINSMRKVGFIKKIEAGKYHSNKGKVNYVQTKYIIEIPNNLKGYSLNH